MRLQARRPLVTDNRRSVLARLDVRFDFHVFPLYEIGVNCQAIARHHPGRRADQLSRSF